MHTPFADNFFILNFAFLRIFKQCLKNYLRYIGHLCLQKRGEKESAIILFTMQHL